MSAIGVASARKRGSRLLPLLGRAGVGHQGQDHELAGQLGRDERHRRGRHHVGDGRQLLGRGLRLGDETGDDVGRGRQQEHPADDGLQRVQPELEPGDHAEAAAAAADGPEQVGVRLVVDLQQPAVGGHQLGREQAVDGQAVLAHQEPDAATKGDPADAHRSGVPEAGDQPVGAGRGGELAGCQARLGPGGPLLRVDLQSLHAGKVEDDAAVGAAVAGGAVPAAAHRQLEAAVAGEGDDPGDLGGVGGADDHGRVEPLEPAVGSVPASSKPGSPGAITSPEKLSRSCWTEMPAGRWRLVAYHSWVVCSFCVWSWRPR